MITDEQLQAGWKAAVQAHNQANLLAQQYNVLLAQAQLEREVPPGFTISPATGKVVPQR